MTAVIAATCLLAGYLAGRLRLGTRAFNLIEDWADRRASRPGRAAAQVAYGLLVASAFAAHPVRFIRNVHANHAAASTPAVPAYDPTWKDHP